jgi:hypothetical protein
MPEPKNEHDYSTSAQDQSQETGSGEPSASDQADGGPGSHNEGQTGGASNDPASGGTPEGADGEGEGSVS